MQFKSSALRTTFIALRRNALLAGALAATCGLVACGSDAKKTTSPGGTTTAGSTTGETTGTVIGGTTAGSTTAGTATACVVPNCDSTGNEPTFSPLSPGATATPSGAGAVPVVMNHVRFQDSNSTAGSANTGTVKQFELAGLDYDPCVFTWDHAQTSAGTENYSLFPTANFNFFGVYLVNGTPGAALTAGTYTAGTTGQYIVNSGAPNPSGTGYGVTNCKATAYEAITGGTIVIDSVDAAHKPISGTFNLTTTNDAGALTPAGTISGAFMVGVCSAASGTQPVAPSPDINACSTLH